MNRLEKQSESDACPLCGGVHFGPYRLGLLQCQSCHLVLSPMIWRQQVNDKMEEEWFGEGYAEDDSFWVSLFERWNNRRTLQRLSIVDLPGKRLLEIGVGSGSFLDAARDQGFEVMGCDLSMPICRRVEASYGITMHCGPLSELKESGQFDVVVMNHVLEHVEAPRAFLHEVCRLLSPGGVAHIAVPNVVCWESALPGWTSYEPYHLSYFSPATLNRVVKASGMAVGICRSHESFSGWFLAILRTLLRVNKQGGAIERPTPSDGSSNVSRRNGLVEHAYRLAMVFFGGALWPIRRVQEMLGYGDEVICLARNQGKARIDHDANI